MLITRLKIVVLIGTTLLSGCVSTVSSCPTPTKIDPAIQRQAAEEVASLPPNSAIPIVLGAALDDRDKLRACRTIN